jgi:hypothetical protein
MTDKFPVPLNGRIVGLALAILGLAVALRVAWFVIGPVVPTLLSLLGAVVVYRVIFRGGKH